MDPRTIGDDNDLQRQIEPTDIPKVDFDEE